MAKNYRIGTVPEPEDYAEVEAAMHRALSRVQMGRLGLKSLMEEPPNNAGIPPEKVRINRTTTERSYD